MTEETLPDVFILETLTLNDESAERFEGRVLKQILSLSGKECQYFYFRTRTELEALLSEFQDSDYRYLHLSCHGDDTSMGTTFDQIPFAELGTLLRPRLRNRRLFLSACQMANKRLAREVLVGSGCYSLLGPSKDVEFGDATLLWSSFYHLMFRTDSAKMQRKSLKAHARSTAELFDVPLRLYLADKTKKAGFSVTNIPASKVKHD